MSKTKGEKMLMGFEYDFDIDGGAVGSIALRQFSGQALEAGDKIVKAYVVVDTAVTSGGTPTVEVGNATDPNGFFEDLYAKLAAGLAVQSGEIAGALLFDAVNKLPLTYNVAADLAMNLAIGTAALTAGKFRVYLEVLA